MLRFFSLAVLVIGLSSCAVSSKVDSNYSLNQQTEMGLLVLNLEKYSKNDRSLFFIEVLNDDTGKRVKRFHVGSKESDFLNTIELPQGRYRLTNICTHNATCSGNFSEKFRVQAAKVLYLGRMQFFVKGTDGGAIFWHKFFKGAQKGDIDALLAAYPNLKLRDIVNHESDL